MGNSLVCVQVFQSNSGLGRLNIKQLCILSLLFNFVLHFTSICEIVIVALVSNQNWFCPNFLLLWVLCLEQRKCWRGKQPC